MNTENQSVAAGVQRKLFIGVKLVPPYYHWSIDVSSDRYAGGHCRLFYSIFTAMNWVKDDYGIDLPRESFDKGESLFSAVQTTTNGITSTTIERIK